MADDRAPRMSSYEYFSCIDRASRADDAREIAAIRRDVLHRYRGDARADDLAEALYAHELRLAGGAPPWAGAAGGDEGA